MNPQRGPILFPGTPGIKGSFQQDPKGPAPCAGTAPASWLAAWMETRGIGLWGAADLSGFETPPGRDGQRLPRAISMALPMSPRVMAGIRNGPNRAYAQEYARVNAQVNRLCADLSGALSRRSLAGLPLAASERTDPVNIRGDFPHKTAATQAGIGWIGRHCQLITRPYGPWVRLGTVFTDMDLACGPPARRSHCGTCTRCVAACPAGALSGRTWRPGVPRVDLLDAQACDLWKKTHYRQFHNGHNCGICASVCPYGRLTRKLRHPA